MPSIKRNLRGFFSCKIPKKISNLESSHLAEAIEDPLLIESNGVARIFSI